MPKTAKLLKSAQGQAVRLSKEFRFEGEEVLIHREGENVILSPRPESTKSISASEKGSTSDSTNNRNGETPEQKTLW